MYSDLCSPILRDFSSDFKHFLWRQVLFDTFITLTKIQWKDQI